MKQVSNAAPLTARSVLASALLGQEPPELPVAHLVHLASLFGINENRARVALSRMAAAGEVSTDGSGRYRLGGHLLARQERQSQSRRADTRPWSGGWRLVVVTATGRAAEDRSALRRRLTLARLAEQREGVWLRPDNIDLQPDPAEEPGVVLYTAWPDGDGAALAAALFDLEEWARRALELATRLDDRPTHGPEDLAPGFELSAAVLRHLQADPLLPAELLPDGWPGTDLRRTYDGWDRQYRRVLAHWGRST
jgi:phenylacetic acid degradation operon negative regulatory protein